jgi:hypothetical protein
VGDAMIDTLIVVKNNHYGLTRDAELLAGAIREFGVSVEVVGISERKLVDRLVGRKLARRAVHIERVFPQWLSAAQENFLIPNQERFPRRHLRRLRRCDLILTKTMEACGAFAGQGVPIEHLGFTSEDRFDPAVVRNWSRVLHLAGGSTLKGTDDVISLWDRHPEWPELVLVQKRQNAPARVADNVKLITGYIDDADLRRLQNECGIHLCPSRSEGWGHNIVEGLSCGALVITTDGAPMNEHIRPEFGLLVAAERSEARHLGTNHFVGLQALEQAIGAAIGMSWSAKQRMGELARQRFVEIDSGFHARAKQLLGSSSLPIER